MSGLCLKSATPNYKCGFICLQSIVSKNALQYRGNSQHDAQEFLLWLLDRVHEDLNHAVKQSGQPPLKVRTWSWALRGERSLLADLQQPLKVGLWGGTGC